MNRLATRNVDRPSGADAAAGVREVSLKKFVERKDVRDQLAGVLPDYQRTLALPLLVPSSGANPGLVGTAFDYAFRFEAQRRNASAKHAEWVADAALVLLARASSKDRHTASLFVGLQTRPAELASITAEATAVVAMARAFVRRYAALRKPSAADRRSLGHHAVRLARLDVILRARLIDGALEAPSVEEVTEVAELVAVIPNGLASGSPVLLNPTFGTYSGLVGGADADIIVGSTLIDIKTTKHPIIEKEMVRQLVGYMILARAARAAKQRIPELDTLAIYLARHAHLWTLPAASVTRAAEFEGFEDWFFRIARTTMLADLTATSLSPRRRPVSKARGTAMSPKKAAS